MKHVLNIATVTAANLRRRIMEVYPSLYAAFESMDVRAGCRRLDLRRSRATSHPSPWLPDAARGWGKGGAW